MNSSRRFANAERRKQQRYIHSLIDLLRPAGARWKQMQAIKRALLELGSETDDNRNCASHLRIRSYKGSSGPPRRGLMLWPSGIPVSLAVHQLERDQIFKFLRKRFPKMSAEESFAL